MWLALSLTSAALLGGYDIAKKAAVRGNAVMVVLLLSTACSWLLLAALALSPWGGEGGLLQVERLPLAQHLQVALKALVVSASWALTLHALQHLPLSLAAPIRASGPAVTVCGAALLMGERPSSWQGVAMATMLASQVGFAWLGRREGIRFERSRPVLWLVLATLLGAASGLYDKLLLQREGLPPNTLQFWFTTYSLLLQAASVLALRRLAPSQIRGFQLRPSVCAVGCLLALADQCYFRALADPAALVSVVSLVRRSSVAISLLLGGLLFGELQLRRKTVPLVGLLAGLALLLLAPV